MYWYIFTLLALTCWTSQISAHGWFLDPVERRAGQTLLDVCGDFQWRFLSGFNNINDLWGWLNDNQNGQPLPADCNWNMCRGYQLEDNGTVYNYPPGEVIDFHYQILNNHSGSANVSVVRTVDNTMISSELIYWNGTQLLAEGQLPFGARKNWPTDDQGCPPSQTYFNVTMPDLGGQCSQVGECVLQMYWLGTLDEADAMWSQKFENCIDFVQHPPYTFTNSSMPVEEALELQNSTSFASGSASGSLSASASASASASVSSSSSAFSSSASLSTSTVPSSSSSAVTIMTSSIPSSTTSPLLGITLPIPIPVINPKPTATKKSTTTTHHKTTKHTTTSHKKTTSTPKRAGNHQQSITSSSKKGKNKKPKSTPVSHNTKSKSQSKSTSKATSTKKKSK